MQKLLSPFKKLLCFINSTKCITGFYVWQSGAALNSIHCYTEYKNKHTKDILCPPVILIQMRMRFYYSKLFLSLFGNKIIINRCACNTPLHILIFAFLKPRSILYTHQGEYQYEHEEAQKYATRLKKYIVKKIHKRNKILCISKLQERFLKSKFGNSINTQIIYNCVPPNNALDILNNKTNNIKIVMIGDFVPRRNPSFYSELSDLAKSNNENWEFYWVGDNHKAYINEYYLSKNVTYIDFTPQTYFIYDKCDIVFLSTMDDPFSMVPLEAFSQYKKVVVYKNVGIAEIIKEKDIKGCAVYEKYDINEAYEVLQRAINEPLDKNKIKDINDNLSSIEVLSENIDGALMNNA